MLPAAVRSWSSDFYLWKIPGKPLAIQLQLDLIERLDREVKQAFKSLPKRGAEVGGLLLGKKRLDGEPTVAIEEFEPIPCEYCRGPSYSLSEKERQALLEAKQRRSISGSALDVVGYYRSHTRKGLFLDEDDLSIITSAFTDPSDVFLLVNPTGGTTSLAGFFFWEDGQIQRQSSYLEFPFSSREIFGADSKPPGPTEDVHQFRAEMLPDEVPLEPPAPDRNQTFPRTASFMSGIAPKKALWPWLAVSVACMGLLGWNVTKAKPGRTGALMLNVERTGADLRLNWNQSAPALLTAQRGVLSIKDGAYHQQVNLPLDYLRTGSLLYSPGTEDVQFRLELFSNDRTSTTESIRVLTGRPTLSAPHSGQVMPLGGEVAAEPAKMLPQPSQAIEPSPAKTLVAGLTATSGDMFSAAPPPSLVPEQRPRFVPPIPAQASEPKLQPILIANEPASNLSAPSDLNVPPDALQLLALSRPSSIRPEVQPEPTNAVHIPANPAALTPVGPAPSLQPAAPDAVRTEPLTSSPSYTEPRPVRQPIPVLPPNIKALISKEIEISIKVKIDPEGRVISAFPISQQGGVSSFVAQACVNAARLWEFQPAKSGGRNVPSETILRFKFGVSPKK